MEGCLNPRLIGVGGPVEGGFFALGDDEVSIGRDPTNLLPIDDPSVSKKHCSIRKLTAEQFEIRDLGSLSGTAVNGLPVAARVLGDRDEIRLGICRFLFLLSGSDEALASVPIRLDRSALDARTIQRLPDGNRLLWNPCCTRPPRIPVCPAVSRFSSKSPGPPRLPAEPRRWPGNRSRASSRLFPPGRARFSCSTAIATIRFLPISGSRWDVARRGARV